MQKESWKAKDSSCTAQCVMVQELTTEEEEGNARSNPNQGHPPKGTERSRIISVAHPTSLHKDTTAELEKAWMFPYTAQKICPLSFYK